MIVNEAAMHRPLCLTFSGGVAKGIAILIQFALAQQSPNTDSATPTR